MFLTSFCCFTLHCFAIVSQLVFLGGFISFLFRFVSFLTVCVPHIGAREYDERIDLWAVGSS